MKKRIFSIFMIFFLCFTFVPSQPTKAVAGLDDAVVITLLTKLLLATGVTILTVEQSKSFYNANSTQPVITEMKNALNTATSATVYISDAFWSDFKVFVNSKFKSGSTVVYLTDQNWSDGLPITPVASASYPYQVIMTDGAGHKRLFCANYPFVYSNFYLKTSKVSTFLDYTYTTLWNLNYSNAAYPAQNVISGTINYSNHDIYTDSSFTTLYKALTNTASKVNATVTPVANDDFYDWVNSKTAERAVYVPTNLTASNLDSYLSQYTGTATSSKVLTEDIPISQTSSSALDLSVPSSIALDFSPLQISLKDKFPFSLPWDFGKLIGSLVAEPIEPKFTVVFPKELLLGGGSFDFDFSKYSKLVLVLRYFILIEFSFGLMKLTKKLPGGS
jgi:hypothetical protein